MNNVVNQLNNLQIKIMNLHHNCQTQNKLIPIFSTVLLIIGGCNNTSEKGLKTDSSPASENYSAINSVNNSVNNSPTTCPNNPTGSLEIQNVKNIQLSSQITTETGQVSANQYVGYTFTAKPGDKLNYQTKDNICIWVYAPNNQLITTKDLSQTGKYIIQVSALQGVTTFSLAMNIENQTNATEITPNVLSSKKSQNTKATKNTSINKSQKGGNNNRISPARVIENYYVYLNKSNYENAWNTLSNRMQNDTTDHPNGYNSYLEWWQKVNHIDTQLLRTKNNGDNATVTIRCTYNLASGRKISSTVKYYLVWNNGSNTWKINNVERI